MPDEVKFYDAIIIGAGIVGSSISYYLKDYDMRVLVLEKNSGLASGTTKANSGIIHAGYDCKPNTRKARFNVEGAQLTRALAQTLGIPFKNCGSLVLSFSEDDDAKVQQLFERGQMNRVPNIKIIDQKEILGMVPQINECVRCALYASDAGVIDPFAFNVTLANNAKLNHVDFHFFEEVRDIQVKKSAANKKNFIVHSNKTVYETAHLINAAGLYSDEINNMISDKKYTIHPRKGQYYLLDKKCGHYTDKILFQVPSEKGKGVLVLPTVDGNILIGPSAETVTSKSDFSTTGETLAAILKTAKKTIPTLSIKETLNTFAGLRAVSGDDFIVEKLNGLDFYNAVGISSPGLSGALAIGKHIAKLVTEHHYEKKSTAPELWRFPKRFSECTTDEKEKLLAKDKRYGRIICSCETISLAEIINAIHYPIGARTLDDLKRYTRAGAGTCQSGFCNNDLLKLLASELDVPPTEILKANAGSNILTEKNKSSLR